MPKKPAVRLDHVRFVAPKTRPFVAWDGEGITYAGDQAQSYVLFGASTGDSIMKPTLRSTDCFDLLLSVANSATNAIHVGFALQYDCNMMFRDLTRRHLFVLYRHNKVKWEGYKIEYRPGKWLTVRKDDRTVRLYDVWGFFQSSFVVACERFLGKDDPELVRIREGKKARSSFTFDQLDTFIVPYWEAELRLLIRLMESLRDDLETADLTLRSWHGPGAVANAVFRQQRIDRARSNDVPIEVNRAAQYAYAGGRFELFRCGHHPGTVYEYDINSAYPAAIARLPNLNEGQWERSQEFDPDSFGVWHVDYRAEVDPRRQFLDPQPLFCRDRKGNVSFPPHVEGWYWTPEARLAAEHVTHGWRFVPRSEELPFTFVGDMYRTRQAWKKAGNSAEKALKLALNSLYGKMAQRAGWKKPTDPLPRWHQLEWAGFVTSSTRALLWQAIVQAGPSLLAVETDAVFTTRPLELDVGDALGQWEESSFDWITYLQSGFWFAGKDGDVTEHYRGFDRGSITASQALQWLQLRDSMGDAVPLLHGYTTRFIGMGLGLFTTAPWRSWQTEPRRVVLGGGGKRAHIPELCQECRDSQPFGSTLHHLSIVTPGGRSHPHMLPWLADQEPELRTLDELERW